jgi:peroxiredoxin
MNDEERAYNVEEFASSAPPGHPGEMLTAKVGLIAPDFEAASLDGSLVRLSDFHGKRHVVIMTGAVTSPMCCFEIPAIK